MPLVELGRRLWAHGGLGFVHKRSQFVVSALNLVDQHCRMTPKTNPNLARNLSVSRKNGM
jgi:hypothetical protein